MTSASPQKGSRKRLAHLAKKTNNRVCCDCPEKAPTWGAIIPPPRHAPMGSRDLVAFLCYKCAEAHRQLGPQVSQVKNITLDEWSEYDVESAEMSGNKYVNQIYEGTLKENQKESAASIKPLAGAHEASRQRFIRNKYVEFVYYSKSSHYKYITQKHANLLSPSTPSTPSYSSGRRSLMTFLKNKDGGGSQSNMDKLAASVTEGTLNTSASGFEQSRDNNHTGKPKAQFPTQRLDRRQSETTKSIASPVALSKRRKSFDPQRGNNSTSASISGWDLEGSFASKSASPGSREKSERQTREDRGKPEHSNSFRLARRDSYRDPRRTSFHDSKGSIGFNPLEDGGDDDDDDDDDDNDEKVVPETPAAGRSRPTLVASKSMPSPANGRLSLYSRKPSTARGRGRSTSRLRDRASNDDAGRERSSSRLRSSNDSGPERSSSRLRVNRDRSQDRERRDSSVEPEKGEKRPTRRSSSRIRNSRSPSKRSSRRTPSPMKIRIKDRGVGSSPRRHRLSRSSSQAFKETAGETRPQRHRHRSPSAKSERKMTEGSSTRARSSSRVRKEDTEESSSSRRRSHRSPSVGKEQATEGSPKKDPSASRSSRGRSRSTSRIRTRGASRDDTERKTSSIRESASRRTARERSRSRTSKADTLGELMKASSRRDVRDSNRSVVSEPTALTRHVQKTKKSEMTGGGGTVVSEPATFRNTEGGDTISPLKKRVSLKGALSQSSKFNGNASQGSISLGLDSVFSEKSRTSQKSGGSKSSYQDTEGEESFQVVSSNSSYSMSAGNRSVPKTNLNGSLTEATRRVGGNDRFENARHRMSRGKVAEKNSQRSSRKNNIFAALDQQDGESSGAMTRKAPLRTLSQSGDGSKRPRPLLARRAGLPSRSKSDVGRLMPKQHMSLTQLGISSVHSSTHGDVEDAKQDDWVDDSARNRADFDKSFASFDF